MKTFGLFKDYGARNSAPVFAAVQQGLAHLGHQCRDMDRQADVAVIWSTVWSGRMKANHAVWREFRATNRPVMVLEIGMLARGHTWKLGLNGTTSTAFWGQGINPDRPKKLDLWVKPWTNRGHNIVIAAQRTDSEQWQGQPTMDSWLASTVTNLRTYTDRPIVVRPHPRQACAIPAGAQLYPAQKVPGTYDDFDFHTAIQDAWAVINWNSGPGCQAVLSGVPAFVGPTSLARPVANTDLSQIETPWRPHRDQWLIDISHTEWTIDEIASGHPLERLASGF